MSVKLQMRQSRSQGFPSNLSSAKKGNGNEVQVVKLILYVEVKKTIFSLQELNNFTNKSFIYSSNSQCQVYFQHMKTEAFDSMAEMQNQVPYSVNMAAESGASGCRSSNIIFKVSTTTSTHNRKSFILYIYINGASTSPFAACSVNNKGCEEKAIITKQSLFPKCQFSSDVFVAVAD